LNRENACAWPRALFFSPLFISFTQDLGTADVDKSEGVEISFQVFFQIVGTDKGNSALVSECIDLLTKQVLTID
jgi:hypothetical protein